VGTAEQSEQLISDLTERFRQNPEDIWSTNIFGKSLCDLVREGMEGKADRLGEDVRMKLRGAVNRMVNEGCRGLVCIML
jgi:stage IV sporulation protein A